jgi:predicted alpha/beta superfamily hydrolase
MNQATNNGLKFLINTTCKVVFFVLCFSVSVLHAQHKVRFEIESKPPSHQNDSFYLVGSFNGWNQGIPAFRFQTSENGKYFIDVNGIPKGIFEYKVTRGNWTKVECNADGTAMLNRIFRFQNDTIIKLDVKGWADDFPGRPPVSTKSKNVFVLDTAFEIPQLNRKRRIWVYLPGDYALSQKKYPVLYMHDGQNLFDVLSASFGEWGVDEMMDSISSSKQCIVVGIDHGGNTRLTEYNPYPSRFGKGEGDAYADFLVKTLKPFIDSAYRTKPLKQHTSIAGSSMGGLISLYAVLKYPEVFGGAGIFSPAFWVAPELLKFIDQSVSTHQPALYFVCGALESDQMVTDMQAVYNKIKVKGNRNLYFKVSETGRHHESFWQQELPAFYLWLRKHQIR